MGKKLFDIYAGKSSMKMQEIFHNFVKGEKTNFKN